MLQCSIKLKVIEERVMFGKFSEQVKKSSQPVNSLVALNAKRMEALSQMQTEFFTGFMSDSVKYVESISAQTEVKGVIAAQTSYAEALKDRFAHTSKDTYAAMNSIREEYTDLLKSSLDESTANVPAAFKAAATAEPKPETSVKKSEAQPKTAAPQKAAVKKVTKKPAAKAKPVVKAASQATEKPTVAAQNKPVTKPVTKPVAKPVVKAEATIKPSTPATAEAKKL